MPPTITRNDFDVLNVYTSTMQVDNATALDTPRPEITILDILLLSSPVLAPLILVMIALLVIVLYKILLELIFVTPLLLNRLLLPIHTRLVPSAKKYILLRPTPSVDFELILPLVIPYLPRRDLVRCCRVNLGFLEVCGKALYGSSGGLVAGEEQYYTWQGASSPMGRYLPKSVRSKPSLFASVDRSKRYDTSEPILPQYFDRLLEVKHPARPSQLKRELFGHVRHLTFGIDICQYSDHDHLDSRDMFPSLITLTLPSIHMSTSIWELPLLANLRPRHIRLTLIRALGTSLSSPRYYLGSGLGFKAKKVTLHFVDCELARPPTTQSLVVGWPKAMNQLDLVFMTPTPSTTLPYHSFVRPQTLTIPESDLRLVAITISTIIASASAMTSGGKIRIVGLTETPGYTLDDDELYGDDLVEDELQTTRFSEILKEEYTTLLKGKGVKQERAEMRAGSLEFVRLKEYMREGGMPPF